MQMQVARFPLVSAAFYFIVGIWLVVAPFTDVHAEEMLPRYGVGIACLVLGALLILGRSFPLRQLSANLFLVACFSLFLFSGFDESGWSTYQKLALVVGIFSLSIVYWYLFRKFEERRPGV